MDSLQLTKAEYEALVEQAPILVWRARTDGLCDYFNERWLSFRGRSMEQELGDGWAEGVHPEDLQRCLGIYQQNFEARSVFEMEYRLMRHDGAYRWIFDRGVPFFAPDGSFCGYIGSCVDVTERVEAQRALGAARDAEIRQLKGLLPICMGCKRIKDNAGYWNQLEVYIRKHSEAEFSHGLCPECAHSMYGELAR